MPDCTRTRGLRAHRGFTLLEVMLVLAILALLAVMIVPRIVEQGNLARTKTTIATIGPNGTLSAAIDVFHVNIGAYPEVLMDLYKRPEWLDESDPRWAPLVKQPSFVDGWGREVIYREPGEISPDAYDLISLGPDGREGTDDDLINTHAL